MGGPGLAVTRGVFGEGAPDARWLARLFTLPGSGPRFLDTFSENSFSELQPLSQRWCGLSVTALL